MRVTGRPHRPRCCQHQSLRPSWVLSWLCHPRETCSDTVLALCRAASRWPNASQVWCLSTWSAPGRGAGAAPWLPRDSEGTRGPGAHPSFALFCDQGPPRQLSRLHRVSNT